MPAPRFAASSGPRFSWSRSAAPRRSPRPLPPIPGGGTLAVEPEAEVGGKPCRVLTYRVDTLVQTFYVSRGRRLRQARPPRGLPRKGRPPELLVPGLTRLPRGVSAPAEAERGMEGPRRRLPDGQRCGHSGVGRVLPEGRALHDAMRIQGRGSEPDSCLVGPVLPDAVRDRARRKNQFARGGRDDPRGAADDRERACGEPIDCGIRSATVLRAPA